VILQDVHQRSSGVTTLLEAMDGAGVSHALLMPNAWIKCGESAMATAARSTWRATDDAERCSVYAYADQMVADAWAALGSEWRLRLAPALGAVSAADHSAVGHLRRMLRKHPGLWRAVVINGAVPGHALLRADTLVNVAGEAVRGIFQTCSDAGLPLLVRAVPCRAVPWQHQDCFVPLRSCPFAQIDMRARMHTQAHAHTHAHARMRTHTRAHRHTHTHAHRHTQPRTPGTHTHTHTRSRTRAHTQVDKQPCSATRAGCNRATRCVACRYGTRRRTAQT
jgi:hypothetical protein